MQTELVGTIPSTSFGTDASRRSSLCAAPSLRNAAAERLHEAYSYAITSGRFPHVVTHHVFKHSQASSIDGQSWLRLAERAGHQLRCLCTGLHSSPLHKREDEYGRQHPYRAKGTEREHAGACVHGDEAHISLAYGAPRGSIVERDGVVSVNFDLMFPEDVKPSGGAGDWQGDQRDYGVALRSIMWLLWVQSRMHRSWPAPVRAEPWGDLLQGAKSIRVNRRGASLTLADVLLTEMTQNWHGSRNYAKLCEAVKTTKRVLVACELPPFDRDVANRKTVDLGKVLDVRLNVTRQLLARALGQAQLAAQRHAAGHSVLAFGFATASKKPTVRSATAQMNQLLLMPVGFGMQPLPTQAHVDAFAHASQSQIPFKVMPDEDPIIAMRQRVNREQAAARLAELRTVPTVQRA